MEPKKIKLGLAPTRRFVFSTEDAHNYKKLVEEKLTSWGIEFVNIDSINEEGLLINMSDAHKAADLFLKEKVDAIFAPHVNFGTEEVVSYMAKKVGKPFLLWGPRDESPLPNGHRLRDTQCGLFATSNVLKKYGVPFSYIVNERIDTETFKRGVHNFLGAVSAANAFQGARIGQVSTRPWNFYTVIINEQELLSRWGIEMVPITMVRVEKTVKELVKNDKRVKEQAAEIKQRIGLEKVEEDMLMRITALKIFMEDWAINENLSAIAFKCHEDLQDALGIYPCFANGLLTGLGIPVICETDIHGALSSILLQNANLNKSSTFFADLTVRHPTNDNAELLWHCGNFSHDLVDKETQNKPFLGTHFIIPPGLPGTGNFKIVDGNITICRFDGINGDYSLMMGHGKSCDGPFNLGTYTWFEVPDWPLWEDHIINGPYVHHVAGVHASVAPALYEATKFIPGLRPDPIQPTEAEIKSYLRGGKL